MNDQCSDEEWGESLLSDLLHDLIDTEAIEAQLHPTVHPDCCFTLTPYRGEAPGISIPDGHYSHLIQALKKMLGLDNMPPDKPYLLADFRMEVAGMKHLFVVTIDPVPAGGEKVHIMRR
jgi:hypothetical protein